MTVTLRDRIEADAAYVALGKLHQARGYLDIAKLRLGEAAAMSDACEITDGASTAEEIIADLVQVIEGRIRAVEEAVGAFDAGNQPGSARLTYAGAI